jgi:hypothetical protein
MAQVVPTQCETRWRAVLSFFDKQHETLIAINSEATEEINIIGTGLIKIGQRIQNSPQQNGNKRLADKTENEKKVLCKNLDGKALFTRMLLLYATAHRGLEDSLLPECAQGKGKAGFRSKRRKRNGDSDDCTSLRKGEATEKCRQLPVYQKPRPVVTKNIFAPLRAVTMAGAEACSKHHLQTKILTKADHRP